MSLKLFLALIVFAGLSIYVAFLNPQEIAVHLTQGLSLHVPMVVLLLGAVLVGVAITSFFNWIGNVRGYFGKMAERSRIKHQEKRFRELGDFFEKAENALTNGHHKKAEALFEKILSIHPGHIDSLYHLGNSLRRGGKFDQAADLHRRAAQLAPDNVKVQYALAEDYSAAGLADRTIETLSKIRARDKGSLQALKKMRDAYLEQQNWEQAGNLQKAILPLIHEGDELESEQQRFCEIIHASGLAHLKSNRTEAAIEEFKRAIRESRGFVPAYVDLGDTYEKNSYPKDALKTWKAGFDNTKAPVFLLRIQKALETAEKYRDIEKLYEAAIRLSEGNQKKSAALLYTAYLIERGQGDKAIKILEDAGEDHSLVRQIFHYAASQATGDNPKIPDSLQSVFLQAKHSLVECPGKTNGAPAAHAAIP